MVLVIIGVVWYTQGSSNTAAPSPTAEQTMGTSSSATTGAAVTAAPVAAVTARDNSDTSLNADLSDINSQITGLGTDAQAAQ